MADTIKLEIVTPERTIVDEEVKIVMVPGYDGEFGVLTGHTPFLTSLSVGRLHFVDSGGAERHVFVSGGFAEALPEKVTVLAESAERRQQIDLDRARRAKERAERRLNAGGPESNIDIPRAKSALLRATHRLAILE
ncbi:MAG: ATP synthase F1 subunit epsilon [Deltaproteobacteria bacterium]|nr:MAG: ATP synthase F1 subunit epsilon [Deltaproteobacteria bacterium]